MYLGLRALPICLLFLIASPLMGQERFLTSLDEVLENYYKANGGLENILSVRSLRLMGRTENPGGEITEIVLIRKRPNLKRLILRQEGNIVHFGFDGETLWKKVEPAYGKPFVEELNPDETTVLNTDEEFDGPLVEPEKTGTELTLLRTDRLERTPVYVVRAQDPDGTTRDVYVNARSFQEEQNVIYEDTEGEKVSVRIVLSDYKQVDGIWIARQVDRYDGEGNLSSSTTIKGIDLNVGIFPGYFDKPSEPEVTEAKKDEGDSGSASSDDAL